jgi:hypothetical protein
MFKLFPLGKIVGNFFRTSLAAGLLLSTLTIAPAAVTTNYFSNFEASSGYTNGVGLDGQNGWIGWDYDSTYFYYRTRSGNSGNGVTAPGLAGSGQAAYVGLTLLPPAYNGALDVAYSTFPSFDPVANGAPVVKFSTKFKINPSSNGNYDSFAIAFYNSTSAPLTTIVFNYYPPFFSTNSSTLGADGAIYTVDATNGYSSDSNFLTGFRVGVQYSIQLTMNFASNTFSATLTDLSAMTNVTFVPSWPITVDGSALTMGRSHVQWLPYDPSNPGDNQFVFDDYLVTSEPQSLPPPSNPTIAVLTYTPGNSAIIRLTGQSSYNYALDYSTNLATGWIPLVTNTVSGTYVDVPDPGAASAKSRFYRGRWVP